MIPTPTREKIMLKRKAKVTSCDKIFHYEILLPAVMFRLGYIYIYFIGYVL